MEKTKLYETSIQQLKEEGSAKFFEDLCRDAHQGRFFLIEENIKNAYKAGVDDALKELLDKTTTILEEHHEFWSHEGECVAECSKLCALLAKLKENQ